MDQKITSRLLSPFHKATRQIEITIADVIKKVVTDIGPVDCHALIYTKTYGPCPTGDIQQVLGLQRSTLTSMLNRLEAKSYITRTPSKTDKRILLLEITAKGSIVADKVNKAVYAFEEQLMAELSDRDLKHIQKLFDAVATVTDVTVVKRNT